MSVRFLEYFRKNTEGATASIAKDRLQIIVAHERAARLQPDYLPELQREIMDVIAKYVNIDQDQVSVQMDRVDNCSVLELNVTLPQ